MPKPPRILISGGGSGGHVFPAIAIANSIKDISSDAEILFVGALGKMEMEKVPAAGYKIIGLPISGFHRKLTLRNLLFPFKLIYSIFKSFSIVVKFKPNVGVGVGGFASGPVLKVASWLNTPILIQEQNSFPGITNRILAGQAKKICTAYEGLERFFPKDRILITGNPVRSEIENMVKVDDPRSFFGLKKDLFTVLVIGGSLGARSINNAIIKNLEAFPNDIQILWQTGSIYFDECKAKSNSIGNIHALKFIKEMNIAYQAADIIISRAGAISISELSFVGKPVVFVPSPNVAEDHQTKNALSLQKKNAAVLISDQEISDKLIDEIHQLRHDEELRNGLSNAIKSFAKPQASKKIAEEVLALIK